MTTIEVVSLTTNLSAAALNLTLLFWRERLHRRCRQHVHDLLPCAAICTLLGHERSPAPDELKALARQAVPAWFNPKSRPSRWRWR